MVFEMVLGCIGYMELSEGYGNRMDGGPLKISEDWKIVLFPPFLTYPTLRHFCNKVSVFERAAVLPNYSPPFRTIQSFLNYMMMYFLNLMILFPKNFCSERRVHNVIIVLKHFIIKSFEYQSDL